jgi:hypothetical protein
MRAPKKALTTTPLKMVNAGALGLALAPALAAAHSTPVISMDLSAMGEQVVRSTRHLLLRTRTPRARR